MNISPCHVHTKSVIIKKEIQLTVPKVVTGDVVYALAVLFKLGTGCHRVKGQRKAWRASHMNGRLDVFLRQGK